MSYDDWKTDSSDPGRGRVEPRKHGGCTECAFKGTAGAMVDHHIATGHVTTWRGWRQACCCPDKRHAINVAEKNMGET